MVGGNLSDMRGPNSQPVYREALPLMDAKMRDGKWMELGFAASCPVLVSVCAVVDAPSNLYREI